MLIFYNIWMRFSEKDIYYLYEHKMMHANTHQFFINKDFLVHANLISHLRNWMSVWMSFMDETWIFLINKDYFMYMFMDVFLVFKKIMDVCNFFLF